MKKLCDRVRNLLLEESNIQPVSSPVTICGDIHGQFWDLLELLRKGGEVPQTSYIFMARRLSRALCRRSIADLVCRVISWTAGTTASKQSLCSLRSRPGACIRYLTSRGSERFCHNRYPDRVTLLRGNHESRQITQVYGFYGPCQICCCFAQRSLLNSRRMPAKVRKRQRLEILLRGV